MSKTQHKYSPGLAGVPAGYTKVSTVGKEGFGLMYRGYSITDLAAKCIFEEVAYLMIYGSLPNKTELDAYKKKLAGLRELHPNLRAALELVPLGAHPMDVMRTGCSILGNLSPESSENTEKDIFNRLMASFGSILLYWYHFNKNGKRIDTKGNSNDTIASHFVRLMHGEEPNPLFVRTVDASLILYAEHGYAASTFACRVTTSTKADVYSAICTAIGTLRGPLHGGANEVCYFFHLFYFLHFFLSSCFYFSLLFIIVCADYSSHSPPFLCFFLLYRLLCISSPSSRPPMKPRRG